MGMLIYNSSRQRGCCEEVIAMTPDSRTPFSIIIYTLNLFMASVPSPRRSLLENELTLSLPLPSQFFPHHQFPVSCDHVIDTIAAGSIVPIVDLKTRMKSSLIACYTQKPSHVKSAHPHSRKHYLIVSGS